MTLSMHHRERLRPRHPSHVVRISDALCARALAAPLTEEAVQVLMAPSRACARRLCQGVATEDQFVVFRTAMRIAHAIELQRVYRGGLGGHIEAALIACSTIHERAMVSGTWKPVPINFNECEAITDMVDLHELQLRKLTGGQIDAVARRLAEETLQDGGEVLRISPLEIGLEQYAYA